MDPIMELAAKHNLFVIEDACQAIGAEYKGRRVGSMGDYGAFSFFPSKNLGCFGDGGAVSCNSAEKEALLKIYRNHGQSGTYIHEYVGGNFRLDALQAAVLSIKLKALDSWSEGRQRNAAEYDELFKDLASRGVIVPPAKASYDVRHIYNQFCIRVAGGKRDALKQYLLDNGIGCAVYYPLSLHLQECFKELGGKVGDYPECEKATEEVLAPPIFGELTADQLACVVDTIKAFAAK
jgi:dTDP-4-amino-4,6-dideoxygalactose transaminase